MRLTMLDILPLWGIFLITVVGVMIAVEAGYLVGRRHQGRHLDTSPVSTMVGASLGLLAFMLAFTFGMAASRFEARKDLVMEDANAIRTAYLRTQLFEDSDNILQVRKLLLDYTDLRIDVSLNMRKYGLGTLAEIEQLQDGLWKKSSEIFRRCNGTNDAQLLVQSMNDVFNIHSKRTTIAFTNRIPGMIWIVLYSVLLFSMASVGYYSGITVSRSRLIAMMLAIAFSAIFLLIGDLDRPNQGFLKVSQQALIAVRNKMDVDAKIFTDKEQKPAALENSNNR